MTSNIAKDPPDWNPHVRTQQAMEGIKSRFKDPDDDLKLVIVRDMWLTGFDNPALHTLYVDKVMSGHNLIQAVNRVATVFRDKPSGLIVDYIGIGDKLRDATKKYTKAGGEGKVAFDIEEAFELMQEVIGELREQLPGGTLTISTAAVRDLQSRTTEPADLQSASVQAGNAAERGLQIPSLENSGLQIRNSDIFSTSIQNAIPWFTALPPGEKLKLVAYAANYLVADDELCKAFMLNEKKLSSLAPIVKSHDRIQELAADIIFLQHVGAALRKLKNPQQNSKRSQGQIKELIHRSIESEAVVDVFQMAGIERFDISIINDDFLATAKEQKTGNELKLELLRQILNDEIKVRSSKNLLKYRKLKDEVERIIADYHNHFFDSLVAMEKIREVARDMQQEDQRRQQLGLTEEEEAFYEILASHPNAIQDFELIKELVRKILAEVKKSASQPDWYKKDDTKAQLQLAVKKVLRFNITSELQEILDEILEQAEERYREWQAAS